MKNKNNPHVNEDGELQGGKSHKDINDYYQRKHNKPNLWDAIKKLFSRKK